MVTRRSLRMPQPRRLTWPQVVAKDISHVLERLNGDRELALVYWNQYRSREILVDALVSSWHTWTVDQLTQLDLVQLDTVHRFYDAVERFRVWATLTEVMPATLERRLDAAVPQVTGLGEAAIEALGGRPPEAEIIPVPPGWKTLHR